VIEVALKFDHWVIEYDMVSKEEKIEKGNYLEGENVKRRKKWIIIVVLF